MAGKDNVQREPANIRHYFKRCAKPSRLTRIHTSYLNKDNLKICKPSFQKY